ncbi:hypothetical protein KIW84_063714 [Lathyrus oleraceus]|uniref:Neutral/alkaline non-lysosomal ceramidase N-terminal domain-containing protein n=1 Tax=Pisum sativum TaxID=3888 RepID=A0A9D4W8C0_PEA|nr:hypothetical protein KIW84_063714 [Pisum sativum]
MAGRRLRDAVKTVLSGDKSFGSNIHVVIAGLTNTYSQHVTTYEELRLYHLKHLQYHLLHLTEQIFHQTLIFSPMNQNPVVIQSLPDAARQGYQAANSQDAENNYHYRGDVQRSPRAFMLSNDFNMKNDSLAQDKPLKQRMGLEGRLRDDRGNHQHHERNERINGDKPDSMKGQP